MSIHSLRWRQKCYSLQKQQHHQMPYAYIYSAVHHMQLRRHGNFSTFFLQSLCASLHTFYHLLLVCASFDPIFKHVSIIFHVKSNINITFDALLYWNFSIVSILFLPFHELLWKKTKCWHINCLSSKSEYNTLQVTYIFWKFSLVITARFVYSKKNVWISNGPIPFT